MINKRNAALFIAIICIILVITGIIYGINHQIDLNNYLLNLENKNNYIFNHIFILLIFLISTLSILGIIIQSIFIGIESIGIGYIISNFIIQYKTKGLIYSVLTILINKGLYILILMYLFVTSINYIKKVILNIIGINKDYTINIIKPLLLKYLVITIILLLYDTLIYFFGNMFLNYLTFML